MLGRLVRRVELVQLAFVGAVTKGESFDLCLQARRQAADDGLLSDDEMSETFEDAFPPPVEEPPNADGEQRAPTP